MDRIDNFVTSKMVDCIDNQHLFIRFGFSKPVEDKEFLHLQAIGIFDGIVEGDEKTYGDGFGFIERSYAPLEHESQHVSFKEALVEYLDYITSIEVEDSNQVSRQDASGQAGYSIYSQMGMSPCDQKRPKLWLNFPKQFILLRKYKFIP